MADGASHTRASVAMAVPSAAFAYIGYEWATGMRSPQAAIGATVGCLAGVFLTPDLDVEAVTNSEWTLVRWTLGLGWLWVIFWWPYAWIFHHRSVFSHFPVLSTAIRLLYVGGLFALWWYLLSLVVAGLTMLLTSGIYWLPDIGLASMWGFCTDNPELAFGLFFGLSVSDTTHWLMDGAPLLKGMGKMAFDEM